MVKWEYCRLYSQVTEINQDNLSIELVILVQFMGKGEDQFVQLAEKRFDGKNYISSAAGFATSALHFLTGSVGQDGWEMVSINHNETFHRNSYATWFAPAFYFKRVLGEAPR